MADEAASSSPSTADYVKTIQAAREAGHVVNIDFSSLPKGIDPSALASELSYGLDKTYKAGLADAAKNGHAVNLDYATATPDPYLGIKSKVSKVAHPVLEIGGQVLGGDLGLAGGGAVGLLGGPAAPATVPAGATTGEFIGGGAGKTLGKMGADALDSAMGYRNPSEPPLQASDIPGYAARGGAEQVIGSKILGPVIKGGAKLAGAGMAKVAPGMMKFLADVPEAVGNAVVKNPTLKAAYEGTADALQGAVGGVQQALKLFKEKAGDVYDAAKTAAGIETERTGTAAAQWLSRGEGKAVPVQKLGDTYTQLVKDAPNMGPQTLLAKLNTLKEQINDHLTPSAFGQKTEEITTRMALKLNQLKTGVMDAMSKLPNGQGLLDASENWHRMRQVYDLLQDKLSETEPATEFFKKALTEQEGKFAPYRNALKVLDATTGTTAGADLENQAISHVANQLMPTGHKLGKHAVVTAVAAAAPGRLVTVPIMMGMQSPKMLTGAYTAAQAAAQALAAKAPTIGAAAAPILDKKLTSMMGNDEP